MSALRSWFGALVATTAIVCVLALNETSAWAILAYTGYLGAVILVPGTIVWNAVITRVEQANGQTASHRTRLEDLVCGAALGYAIEIPSYAVARWLDVPRAYVLVEALIIGWWLLAKRPWRSGSWSGRPGWGAWPALALAGVVGYAAAWLGARGFATFPVSREGVFPDTDDPFHLALIAELAQHFPGVYPYVAQETLTYQYLYHLHAAASTWTAGVSALEAFARFDPVVFTALGISGAACLSRRLSGRPWIGVLAAAVLVLVGSFDISGRFQGQAVVEERFLATLLVHAPNHAMAFALATPLLVLALQLVGPDRRLTWVGWAAFFLLGVVMTGVKVIFVPMLIAGLLATACLSALRETRRALSASAGALVCLAALLLCIVVIYRGQSRQLVIAPLSASEYFAGFFQVDADGWLGKAYVMSLLMTTVLVPAAGVVGLATRQLRRDPRAWTLTFVAAAGLAAFVIFGHPGVSQRYFLYASSWVLAVASAWGLSALFPPGTPRSVYARSIGYAVAAGLALFGVRLVAQSRLEVRELASGELTARTGFPASLDLPVIAVLALAFGAVAALLRSEGRGHGFPGVLVVVLMGLGLARAFAFVTGDQPPSDGAVLRVSAEGVEAARWLRENAGHSDLVMTNAHCASSPSAEENACDNRHFWMSALAERRFLVEGWGYLGAGNDGYFEPYADAELVAENDALFTAASAEGVRAFVARHGVDWMLVDRAEPVDLDRLTTTPGVRVVLVNPGYAVLALDPPTT